MGTIYTINEAGLAFISTELQARHKRFQDGREPTRDMLSAWAADAEQSLNDGDSEGSIEISQFDSISGHTETVRLDTAEHFTAEIVTDIT